MDKKVQIKLITYDEERLRHFTDLMEKAQKQYDRLYKRHCESPYLFDGTTLLSDAGRELQFYKDVVSMLKQGYRKDSDAIREIFVKIEDISKTIGVPEILANGIIRSRNLNGLYIEEQDFANLKKIYVEGDW